ncbi:MAG: hypothetical protein J5642_02920 [Bacteroidales bacterium]|nr:hypothetical protein [Bacteroidales bacterium]
MKCSRVLLLWVMLGMGSIFAASGGPITPKKIGSDNPLENYFQYGFHLGTDIVLGTRQLSDYDNLKTVLSGTFGFFARGGYKYIFGELGLNYMFYKGRYEVRGENDLFLGEETVESRYLQIPLKVVGRIPVGKICAFLPQAGAAYQPLIHVTKNDIGYGKKNLMQHQFYYQAGLAFQVKFFMVELSYKHAIRPFYSNKSSVKQSYVNIMIGVQL